ncbi:amino acid ABC transporter permease [Gluconobacter sphaericus]|uniref:Glutamate/aspartate import permease protein GltK n=1 Tax=Gluconobacter sphaericus NBRC 12467 TaxID=1307951 RepID=A0AA37SG45_9PROT|nr:amino acid ABC transporter permease [Gluconobacter sphaericus]MBF0884807.1 amino acid ABC transporter permease [Gluconobacter sphaericus]MBS1085702.1 amino acid ABC transporter permease [Gluconobacter sphaericus]MBS1097666.1 amino acid ABC transporter permease [Gluconobacter sphaericus]MBS1100013.1 amino acid ABC transporter permease [Gluconobacter sphaericus]QQX90293.1 amino acid ABC transporter permease [Gluconobacter sphaericus]
MQIWSWNGFFTYLGSPYIFRGALITVYMTAVSMLMGFLLGLLLAVMKRSQRRLLSWPARFYVWFFRGTPLLVQLVVIYAGLPKLDIRLSVMACSIIGLTLNEAAYLAEIIRAGLNAVPTGQIAAARALGLSERQIAWRIAFPQAFRLIIPPLGNSVNGLLKTTSVTSVISMEELMQRSQILVQDQFMVLELFSVAALYYLLMTTVWDFLQRRIEHYAERPYRRQQQSAAVDPIEMPVTAQDAR